MDSRYEGRNSRAACEGFTTNYNAVPDAMVNTELVSPVLAPGAGAISHHFGILHGRAKNILTAGSELTINYGDWDFDDEPHKYSVQPHRVVSWLHVTKTAGALTTLKSV